MKKIILLFIIISFGIIFAYGQKPVAKTPENKKDERGTISGQVLDESGSPIENAEVQLTSLGAATSRKFIKTISGKNGKFVFENLKPVRYKIIVRLAGYVLSPPENTPNEQETFFQIGNNAKLYMRKGGVITGKVTDGENNLIIEIPVQVVRVRDEFGRKIPAKEIFQGLRQNLTNDRGIYRIFGLEAGSYLVYVGGNDEYSKINLASTNNIPIYYPSDSIDTAAEVRVDFDQIAESIDIKFREKRGFMISGSITGIENQAADEYVSVILTHRESEQQIAFVPVESKAGKYAFKIEAVPEGEYSIQAKIGKFNAAIKKSPSQNIFVQGKDVNGLTLNLKTLASIKGKAIYTENAKLFENKECEKPKINALQEMILNVENDASDKKLLQSESDILLENADSPDEKGDFEISGLESGNYRLNVNLNDKNLYVEKMIRSISPTLETDLSKNGINLSNTLNFDNAKVYVQNGAASLSGKVKMAKNETVSNSSRFIVYLIPAEKDSGEDVLRFRQVVSNADSSFSFSNLLPGNYFLIAEKYPESLDDFNMLNRPKFFDAQERSKLIELASKQNEQIQLAPCQNIQKEIFVSK